MVLCECGCGQELPTPKYPSIRRRFINGHAWKGRHHTEEAKKKNRDAHHGKHLSEEHKRKIGDAGRGHPVSEETKSKIGDAQRGEKNHMFGKHPSEETKLKMSKASTGRIFSKEHNRKISEALRGKPRFDLRNKKFTEEHKQKIREALSGENNPSWKGGISPLTIKIRNSFKYQQWRDAVLIRDNNSCQKCGRKSGKFFAHHIKNFSDILEEHKIENLEQALVCEEFWGIENGVTLCKSCHRMEHGIAQSAYEE